MLIPKSFPFHDRYDLFVGYQGPDPGSAVSLAKKILILPALSAIDRGSQIKVSPEVVWEGAGTRFLHPWDVWMWEIGVHSSLHAY